jgi:hypothetical protein
MERGVAMKEDSQSKVPEVGGASDSASKVLRCLSNQVRKIADIHGARSGTQSMGGMTHADLNAAGSVRGA